MSFQFSVDGGDTFVETTTNTFNILASNEPTEESDGQGTYDLALWADPENAQTVIVGGVNIWKSISSGILWSEVMHWTNEPPEYTHADIHALETNPFTGELVAGTDGGLYASSDGGIEWANRGRGLGITQYYHLDVWSDFLGVPFVSGGAQDNGTSGGLGFADPTFDMIGGGDGFRTYRGAADGQQVRYRSVQNGKLFFQDLVADSWFEYHITPEDQLNGNDEGQGIWDTPYQPNPNTFAELLAGYDQLYFSNDFGSDWISLDYPSGFSYDGTGMISQIAWSPVNGNVVYFFIADGSKRHMYKCEAFYAAVITGTLELALCTVQNLDTVAVMPADTLSSGRPTDIGLSAINSDEVWLSFGGYTDSMKVFYNADMAGGAPWMNLSYNLPNVPVHCVEWDVDGLYAGTDIGVFYLQHGDESWIYFSEGLPTVAATEIEIRNTFLGKAIFASTWGRGIWWSTPPTPIRRTRWYVDDSAMGTNTGASWTNALTNLQTALDTILPGDSIWVAAGTYLPETTSGFHLSHSNVYIWGGFNGTEDSISQRDFNINITLLSGDLGVLDDSTDNANHVFAFGGQNDNVLLDGFEIANGYAKENGVLSTGGGIYYSTGTQSGKPRIRNCRIRNNACLGGGGFSNHIGFGAGMYIADFVSGDAPMYISNCVFENNHALNRGGGLAIDAYKSSFPLDTGKAVVFLDSCTFVNNIAGAEGGGIYLEATHQADIKLFMTDSELNNNTVEYFQGTGGGLSGDVTPGAGTIGLFCTNVDFQANTLNPQYAYGGAVFLDGTSGNTTSVFNNCTFDGNIAGDGGAVFLNSPGTASMNSQTFENCTIENNSGSAGGALYFNIVSRGNGNIAINGCSINDNSSTGRGGAIYFNGDNGGHILASMDSTTVNGNEANENGAIRFFIRKGGSAFQGSGALTITDCSFTENSANIGAGGALGIYSQACQVEALVMGSDFSDNSTSTNGGAISCIHDAFDTSFLNVTYTNCDFSGNSVEISGGNGGGAISFSRSDCLVNDCSFTGNTGKYGGAVYNLTNGLASTYTQTFQNCDFIANKGTDRGGAIYLLHNDPTIMDLNIIDCVFDSNYNTAVSGSGGAIYTHGEGRAIQSISSSTFIDNIAKTDGGAIFLGRLTGAPLTDTLFVFLYGCMFTNNDAGTSGESIEQYGNGAVISSIWQNCDFINDEPNTIFLNRDGQGTSIAKFINCNIETGNEDQQGILPPVPILSLPDLQPVLPSNRN
jgi:predicted outer membrane repeat protein